MKLAELFVEIAAKGIGTVNKDVEGLKKTLAPLKSHFDAIQTAAKGFLAGVAGAATFAIKQFADEEAAQSNLRAALAATGQEVERNATRLVAFANHLQDITTASNDALENLMAYAANLGVTADQTENVIRVGIGLGKAFFGGDSQAGIDAAAKATQGNFRALQKLIPGLKQAKSAQDALNIVSAAGQRGFQQATKETDTFWGKLKQLWNQVGDLAKAYGELLLPALHTVADYVKAVTTRIQQLTPAQQQQIISWTKYAAAIAAVIAFGPAVLKFTASVAEGLVGVGKVAVATGRLLIAGLLSPFGLVVAGLAAVATGFAYFAGTGNSALSAVISGFQRLWNAMVFVFGNTSSLSAAWSAMFTEVAFIFEDSWINATSAVRDLFIRFKGWVNTIWTELGDDLLQGSFVWAEDFLTIFVKTFQSLRKMTVDVGDGIASYWVSLKQKLGLITPQQAADAQKIIGQSNVATNGRNDSEDSAELAAIKKWYDEKHAYIDKLRQTKREGLAKEVEEERQANDKVQADALRKNQTAQKNFERDLAERNKGMASLADQAKSLFDNLRKGTGIDDMLAQIEAIKKEAEKIKADAQAEGKDAGNFGLNLGGGAKQKGNKPTMRGLDDVFRENVAAKAFGMDQGKKDEVIRRQEMDSRNKNTRAVQDLTTAIKFSFQGVNGTGSGVATVG